MTVAEATTEITPREVDALAHDRAFLGHPKGLGFLSFVEGCERFSYYSMQTLLTLYMVNFLLTPEHQGSVWGLNWLTAHYYTGLSGQPLASAIFGDYTALVYFTPIFGGIIADRWLGRRGALVTGGLIMALGHFLMAVQPAFLLALLCLVVGVGLFKGNIASQVGELYQPDDIRRATAFQLFYIAIQVSVIVAPLISGTLGEKFGWHYGFGCAGVVMVVGFLVYLKAKPWLPLDSRERERATGEKQRLVAGDGGRILALVLLVPSLALILLPNQQIFNAYLVWADQHFQLTFFGTTLPTSWMITLDATFSFVTLVGITAFWPWWGRRGGWEPDDLTKLIIGSVFIVAGVLCLYMAALTQGSGKIGLFWPVMFHLLNSIGFGHVLPLSLALVSRIAPKAMTATAVGIYYLAFVLANKVVGVVGGWYSTMATTQFWLLHAAAAVVGLVAFAILKFVLPRMMGETAPIPG